VHDAPIILNGAIDAEVVEVGVAGGQVIAYTCRSPYMDKENEDAIVIVPYGPGAAVLVVADGAGGLPAGRRASMTAVSTLANSLQVAMGNTMLLRTAILNGIEAANNAVLELANGSATTLTVITIEGRLVRSYQIGDSEAIVMGQRGLIKLQTTAHSPTGFAVEAGFLDEREALHHKDRHIVSNFLGTSDMRIDVGAAADLDLKDTILLASDGLMDNVHVDEIIEIVRKGPIVDALHGLVNLANQRMQNTEKGQPSKPDDLSVILFRKPGVEKGYKINGL
jgi:serine/threonine protein phosphatase PrpC